MRVVPLLITALLLAVPVFGQQASSTNSKPEKTSAATKNQTRVMIVDGKRVEVVKAQPNPERPAHPITAEQLHEMMQITHANDLARNNLLHKFAVFRLSMPPYFPQDVFVDILIQSQKIDFEPIEKPIYQDHISAEDAAKIIAFYKTPAGQHLIAAMPGIEKAMNTEGAREGHEIAQRIINEHSDEIKAAAAKYQAEHPDGSKTASPN